MVASGLHFMLLYNYPPPELERLLEICTVSINTDILVKYYSLTSKTTGIKIILK